MTDEINESGSLTKEGRVLREARKRLEAAYLYDKENRDEALKDLQFLGLNQWPDSVRQQRLAEQRPVLTLDHLNQYVQQVVGDIRQSKIELRAVGVDSKSDPDLAELVTGLMRDVQHNSSASHVYAEAAEDQVSCGIGHFRFVTEYSEDSVFDQELLIKTVPYALSVYWDSAAYEPDRSDAQWCFVTESVPIADFKEKYPDAKLTDIEVPKDWNTQSAFSWSTKDSVLVAEYWKKVASKRRLVAFEDGSTFDLTDADDSEIAELEASHGPVKGEREANGHRIKHYLLTGDELLEEGDWAGRHIPIIPIVGPEIHLENKCIRTSLIRGARDGQQLYNYWRSAAAELIALAPKSKWLVTAKQIAQFKSQWDKSNLSPQPYLMYEPDERVSEGKPSRVAPPDAPAAMWREAELVVDDLKSATGIYDASLGARGNETSGVAIARRQQEGDVSNFHFSDNLQRSLGHAGRVMLDLIPKIYDSERTIRLLGADDTVDFRPINQTVTGIDGQSEILNDLSAARFDIRVDIGPSYTTQRIEAATSMMDYAKSDPTALPVFRDLLVANMDWPGAQQMAERLKKSIPPQYLDADEQQGQPQQQAPDPQLVMQQQRMQVDAQNQQAKLQLEQQKAVQEMQIKQAELDMERKKLELEHATAIQKLQLEAEIAKQKLALEQQIAAAKLQAEDQDRALKRASELEKQQTSAHIAAQNGAMLHLGEAVAQAAVAASKPRRTTIERDARGNATGSRSEIEAEE